MQPLAAPPAFTPTCVSGGSSLAVLPHSGVIHHILLRAEHSHCLQCSCSTRGDGRRRAGRWAREPMAFGNAHCSSTTVNAPAGRAAAARNDGNGAVRWRCCTDVLDIPCATHRHACSTKLTLGQLPTEIRLQYTNRGSCLQAWPASPAAAQASPCPEGSLPSSWRPLRPAC